MSPPRTAALAMVSKARWAGLSAGRAARLVVAMPRMAPSTLFISWATPPARLPRLSIFCACCSWAWSLARSCSSLRRSVMSRVTERMCCSPSISM